MKLSMWMIANRLKPLNPEFQISDDSPAVLKVPGVLMPATVFMCFPVETMFSANGKMTRSD